METYLQEKGKRIFATWWYMASIGPFLPVYIENVDIRYVQHCYIEVN